MDPTLYAQETEEIDLEMEYGDEPPHDDQWERLCELAKACGF